MAQEDVTVAHEFDLAQLELQSRQLHERELRTTGIIFETKPDADGKVRRKSEADVRSIISKWVHKSATPIQVQPVKDGIYLGVHRRSKRDPTRLYEGTSTCFELPLSNPLRRKVITIIDSVYFELFILSVIFFNALTIAWDNPTIEQSQGAETALFVFNILFIAIYSVEMILRMIACGIMFNGMHSYFYSGWNVMDFIIVVLGYIEFLPVMNSKFAAIRAVRVLRPLRSINSIPGMKILVASLLRALSMMGNVMVLTFFTFLLFGLMGMQLFHGKMQDEHGENPNYGITGFDNIGMAWLTILQCVSLEGWIDVAYVVSENTYQISILFFVALVIFGEWFVMNLVVGVIASAYEDEKERQEALSRQLKSVRSVTSVFKSAMRKSSKFTTDAVKKSAKSLRKGSVHVNQQILQLANIRNPSIPQRDMEEEARSRVDEENDDPHPGEQEDHRLSPLERGRRQISALFPLEMACFKIAESNRFESTVMALIILNTIVLACEWYPEPAEWMLFQDIANYVFTALFVLEFMVKITGYGIRQYFREQFNRFDFVIVALNLAEIIMGKVLHVESLSGLSVFRSFRLIKVFRLARSWVVLRDLLQTIGKSMDSLVHFSFVLALFIFIYALLGMQFFAGTMFVDEEHTEVSRANFDTFWWSIVTVFQIISGENWNEVLYLTIVNTDHFLGIAFCGTLFVFGNYVMLNLFLAILLSNFDDQFDESSSSSTATEESLPLMSRGRARDPSSMWNSQKTISKLQVLPQREEDLHLYIDEIGYVLNHKNTTVREEMVSLFRAEKVILYGKSLLCLSATNCVRIRCAWLVQQPFFELFILLTIFVSSAVLVLDEPDLDRESARASFLLVSEFVFTVIFCVEALLKIIAHGLVLTPSAYLKERWNYIDITAIIFSILDLSLGHSEFSFLRVVRAFRALRIIRRIDGMRVVAVAMVQSIKPVVNVILIFLLFFFVFAVLGVQMFKGKFNYCHDVDANDLGLGKAECAEGGGVWKNPNFGSFDHIGHSLEILFQISTLEMWPDLMYRAVDVDTPDTAPIRDNHPEYALYFIVFISLTNFFIMNLFVGVVVDHFNSAKNKLEGGLLTPQQRQWVNLKKLMAATSTSTEKLSYKKPTLAEDDTFNYYHQLLQHGNISRMESAVYYYILFFKFKFRMMAFRVVTNARFDYFIMLCIVLNTMVLLTFHVGQSEGWHMFQFVLNKIFLAIFTVEMLLKLYGLGSDQYFQSKANIFDFVIVVCSYGIELFQFHRDISWLRVFRVLRLLRLVQRAKGLKVLVQTLIYALPSLTNVVLLLFLIFFIYGVLGMGLFGGTPHNESDHSFINRHCNFDNFFTSIITLFRVATGESWNGIMRQLLPEQCEYMSGGVECGSYLAIPYFLSFIIIVSFIILNVVIAVILEHFEIQNDQESNNTLSVKQSDVDAFDDSWALHIEQQYKWYQPRNESYLWIRAEELEVMLLKMRGMLGLRDKQWSRMERFQFLSKLEIPLHRKHDTKLQRDGIFVQYYQVQLALGLLLLMRQHGDWVQEQVTRQTKFARIAVHRKTDWKLAKKLLNSDAAAVHGVKLIEIIAAIKIQAMAKGYLTRKRLRLMLSRDA